MIKGKPIDDHTRCVHYHSPLDIIAIKFRCCNEYYPCFECHVETAGHDPQVWFREEFDTEAIFCGDCKTELSINEYLACGNQCPRCGSLFNPGCKHHHHLYFQV